MSWPSLLRWPEPGSASLRRHRLRLKPERDDHLWRRMSSVRRTDGAAQRPTISLFGTITAVVGGCPSSLRPGASLMLDPDVGDAGRSQVQPEQGRQDMTRVWGFFYGGLINPVVMARVGMAPSRQEVATLPGYELTIAPLVNLVPRADAFAHGLLLELTHGEIDHVYGQLKARYLPFPVLAHRSDGLAQPALCYVVPDMSIAEAERDHVLNLLEPAATLGFPEWYLERIRSFLPASPS